MSNQAIIKRTYTTTVTFAQTPSKETREALAKYGFQYDRGNWFRSHKNGDVIGEEVVANELAA